MLIAFFRGNWTNILLIVTGCTALFVYYSTEKRKISEAASLISLQIYDIQKRMREFQTYIDNNNINSVAFYESQILFNENYWEKYKHYFVNKLNVNDYNLFNEFYNTASEVKEQQEYLKRIQKNRLLLIQEYVLKEEAGFVSDGIKQVDGNNGLKTENADGVNWDVFQEEFRRNKANLHRVINDNNTFMDYIPGQITISMNRALKSNASIQILGCEGFRRIQRISKKNDSFMKQ